MIRVFGSLLLGTIGESDQERALLCDSVDHKTGDPTWLDHGGETHFLGLWGGVDEETTEDS